MGSVPGIARNHDRVRSGLPCRFYALQIGDNGLRVAVRHVERWHGRTRRDLRLFSASSKQNDDLFVFPRRKTCKLRGICSPTALTQRVDESERCAHQPSAAHQLAFCIARSVAVRAHRNVLYDVLPRRYLRTRFALRERGAARECKHRCDDSVVHVVPPKT